MNRRKRGKWLPVTTRYWPSTVALRAAKDALFAAAPRVIEAPAPPKVACLVLGRTL